MTFNIPDQWVEIPIIGQWLHDAVAAIPRVAQSILLEFKDLIPLVGRGMGALLQGLLSQLLQAILTGISFFFFLRRARSSSHPLLIGHLLHYPIIVVIFGVIGGLLAFGLIGLFIGPCILVTLMKVWLQWVNNSSSDKD